MTIIIIITIIIIVILTKTVQTNCSQTIKVLKRITKINKTVMPRFSNSVCNGANFRKKLVLQCFRATLPWIWVTMCMHR